MKLHVLGIDLGKTVFKADSSAGWTIRYWSAALRLAFLPNRPLIHPRTP
jgi:hypothetical protein